MKKRRKLKRTDQPFKNFRNGLFRLYTSPEGQDLLKMDHLSSVLWLRLFRNYYINESCSFEVPEHDDSRWDVLLHEIGGMQADNRVRKIISRLRRKTIQKAA